MLHHHLSHLRSSLLLWLHVELLEVPVVQPWSFQASLFVGADDLPVDPLALALEAEVETEQQAHRLWYEAIYLWLAEQQYLQGQRWHDPMVAVPALAAASGVGLPKLRSPMA